MASILQTIVQYFESKGLSANAIAGIVGNFQVESGLDTGAANSSEGAIGLGQWEGSRRTALQQFASAHGTSETDLGTQLAFAWQEMNQRGLVQQLNSASSPGQAADLWDQKFEVSAGTTRAQREGYANQYATSGSLPAGGAEVASGNTSYALTMGTGSAVPTLTAAQKREALQSGAGDLYSLATAVPELSNLINTAITKGWTATEFQNAVTNSAWYKTHSDTLRQSIALKVSDPATYARNLQAASDHVGAIAHQLGVGTGAATRGIALQYIQNGWNDEQLTQYLGNANNHLFWSGQSGAMGTALNKYTQIASDYGVGVTGATLQWWARKTAVGLATEDQFVKQMEQTAASVYPGLKDQLVSGQTTKQLADPYVQQMAQTLELDPNTIKWSQDPLIKRALQTYSTPSTPAAAGAKPAAPTPPGTTPLWQFEQQLRSDPRWQLTNNAKQATASMLTQLGNEWGFTK
jgi:Rod binding domain-containing protein